MCALVLWGGAWRWLKYLSLPEAVQVSRPVESLARAEANTWE